MAHAISALALATFLLLAIPAQAQTSPKGTVPTALGSQTYENCTVTFKGSSVALVFKQGTIQLSTGAKISGLVDKAKRTFLEINEGVVSFRRNKGKTIYTLVGLGQGKTKGDIKGPHTGWWRCK